MVLLMDHQCPFSGMPLFFSSKRATTFFIKNRYSVLHSVLQKYSQLDLISDLKVKEIPS